MVWTEKKVLLSISLFVLALGGLTLYTLTDHSSPNQRKLASIDLNAPLENTSKLLGKLEYKFDCSKKNRIQSTARYIRFKGQPCSDKKNSYTSKIRNENLKIDATTLISKGGNYSSDFLQVSSGANTITITHEFDDGHIESHTVIVQTY